MLQGVWDVRVGLLFVEEEKPGHRCVSNGWPIRWVGHGVREKGKTQSQL